MFLSVAGGSAAQDLLSNWQLLDQLRYNEAHDAFEAVFEEQPQNAESALGLAVALMSLEDRKPTHFTKAGELIDWVAETSEEQDIQQFAKYLKVRLETLHEVEADPSIRRDAYFDLWKRYPGSEVGELAFLKFSLTRMYEPEPAAEKRATMRELAELAESMQIPRLKRNFHRAIAEAYARQFSDHEQALLHSEKALALDIEKWNARGRTMVRAGKHAMELGKTEVALRYFREFEADSPRDARIHKVPQYIEKLEQ